jgi:uncharacterized membrane protein
VLTLIILPPSDAMVGDYTVSFWAYGTQTGAVADIRVTVTPPTMWGWVGAIVSVIIIGGLFFVYTRFRRR